MTGSQSITRIAGALLKAQRNMGDAKKGANNPFFKSSYADLNSIRETVIPVLNAEGVSVLQPTITLGEKNFVETVLLHESGEWIAGLTEIVNVKGDAQSEGSGISYARRYGLQSLCNVGAVDDDGESAQGRTRVATVANKSTSTAVAKTVYAGNEEVSGKAKGSPPAIAKTGITKDLIGEAFKTLEQLKKVTKESFKKDFLGGRGLSSIPETELSDIYTKVKSALSAGESNGKR